MSVTLPLIVLAVLLVLIGLGFVLCRGRTRKWVTIVWIPAIAVPVILLFLLFGGQTRAYPGPDGGAVAMSMGYGMIGNLITFVPFLVVAVLALVFRPCRVAWTWSGAMVGVGSTVAFAALWPIWTTTPVEVVVLDPAGRFAPGITVYATRFEHGINLAGESSVSNAAGMVRFRVPNGALWSVAAQHTSGTICRVGFSIPANVLPGRPEHRQRRWHWHHASWGWIDSSLNEYAAPREMQRVELRLRERSDVISPWVVAALRESIARLAAGNPPSAELLDIDRSPEWLVVLPDLLRVMRDDPIRFQQHAHWLADLADQMAAAAETAAAGRDGQISSEKEAHFRILSVWVGNDWVPTDRRVVADQIEAQLRGLARELIDAAKPQWSTNGPVGFADLRSLQCPFVGEALAWMETEADPARVRQFAHVLGRSRCDLTEVRPFFDSSRREVAFCALAMATDQMPSSEILPRLKKLSHPGEQNWLQFEIEALVRRLQQPL